MEIIIRGICGTKGNVFFKTAISRGGFFITLCIAVVPESLSDRPGFHCTTFCTNMEGEEGFWAAELGFLRCGYGVFSLLL